MEISDHMMREQMFATFTALEHAAKAYTISQLPSVPQQKPEPDCSIREMPVISTVDVLLEEELARLNKIIQEHDKTLQDHRKALALVSAFGMFKEAGFFCGSRPVEAIERLTGLRACSCVGTGWVARDECCGDCGGRGYIKR